MAVFGGKIASGSIDDYTPVKAAAEEIGVHDSTLKRWLRDKKVPNAEWGRDNRGWIFVKKESIKILRDHKNTINLE